MGFRPQSYGSPRSEIRTGVLSLMLCRTSRFCLIFLSGAPLAGSWNGNSRLYLFLAQQYQHRWLQPENGLSTSSESSCYRTYGLDASPLPHLTSLECAKLIMLLVKPYFYHRHSKFSSTMTCHLEHSLFWDNNTFSADGQ